MTSFLGKFKQIVVGWKNLAFENEAIEEIATERAIKCGECPHNIDNKCNLCGCYLPAKTRSPESKCPDNKW